MGVGRAVPAGLRVENKIVFRVETKSVCEKKPWEQGALSFLSHVFCVPNAEFTKSPFFVLFFELRKMHGVTFSDSQLKRKSLVRISRMSRDSHVCVCVLRLTSTHVTYVTWSTCLRMCVTKA